MADYRACNWPSTLRMGSEQLARAFDECNERQLVRSSEQAITPYWVLLLMLLALSPLGHIPFPPHPTIPYTIAAT